MQYGVAKPELETRFRKVRAVIWGGVAQSKERFEKAGRSCPLSNTRQAIGREQMVELVGELGGNASLEDKEKFLDATIGEIELGKTFLSEDRCKGGE